MAAVGPYELREPIGEDETAQVFRGVGPDAEVAVTVLRGDASPEQVARFELEATIAEGIDHPHVIRVIDHGVDATLGPWLATPLVHGMTLRDLYHGKRLCPEAATLLLAPLAEALAALHARGLVHRDVKPENLVVSPVGDVTLGGLGAALVELGTGSGPYRAPERIEGRDVDPSTDVWAFGVMLYELCAGRRPFEREPASEEEAAILSGGFVPLAEADRRVGPELDWLVSVCLATEAWKRPKDGAALLDRLRPLVYGAHEDARELRVSVLSDGGAFVRKVAPRVTEALRERARVLLAEGDTLEASRQLDRALAYDPDDEATLALLEQASSGAPYEPKKPVVGTTERAVSSSRRWAPWAALAGITALGTAAAVYIDSVDRAPATRSPRETEVAESPDAGSTRPAVTPLEYRPIPPDASSNDDPPRLDGLAAGAGEPLVEARALPGDPEAALAEGDPADPAQQARRALALLALRRTEEGLAAIRALEVTHPRDPGALTAAGYVALRRGRFADAETLLSHAIEVDERHQPALRYRGRLRIRRGHTRDGYHDLQRALAIDPDDLDALIEMTEVYERAHRPRDAVPFLRRIVNGHPQHETAWVSLAIALSASSDAADVDEAIESVERGLELAPTSSRGLVLRCTLLSRHERAGAVPACAEAIRVSPGDPELFLARGLELARQGELVPALADADRAVELAPDVPRMYASRAILRGRAGDLDGAHSDLRVACRLGHPASCERLEADGVPR